MSHMVYGTVIVSVPRIIPETLSTNPHIVLELAKIALAKLYVKTLVNLVVRQIATLLQLSLELLHLPAKSTRTTTTFQVLPTYSITLQHQMLTRPIVPRLLLWKFDR